MAVGQMIGRIISHYRIVEKLGAGGMGLVFRAHDEQLERDVAIKFLPPGLLSDDLARRRFHKEALTLARLHHPNIGTIYEFGSEEGSDYLVMECIPGTTLAERLVYGPLAEKEALAIAAQVAAAIEEAHEQGVVHCDLKPANVMLTPKGQVKVLDFGVARLAQRVVDESSTTTSSSDESGLMAGTLPYMAPEQLFGEATDERTDIHAFGALLYEMITGRRAFPDFSVPRITEAVLHRTPAAPSTLITGVSRELERITMKCLEKSPDDRYQFAKELCVDLRRLATPATSTEAIPLPPSRRLLRWGVWVGAAALLILFVAALVEPRFRQWGRQALGIGIGQSIHSLAVLPVTELSGNPAQAYFADGLTDVMTRELAEVHRLKVISAESTMQYKGQGMPLARIAGGLDVDALIVASVRRAGDTVHLMVRLIRPSDGAQLWARAYNCHLQEIPRVSNEIVGSVARRMHVPLTPEEQLHLADIPNVTPAAEDAYLQGVAALDKRTEGSLDMARGAFERAIAADNDYAPAYAGLAQAYVLCACQGRRHSSLMAKAKDAALHALELDDSLAEPHAALGFAEMSYNYDWAAAQRELKRAVALNPNSTEAHLFYGELLVATGRFREGIGEMRQAVTLDPLSAPVNASLGLALYHARDNEAAIEQFQDTLVMNPNNGGAITGLGLAFLQAGNHLQAAAQFQKAIALGYEVTLSTAHLAQTYALMGSKDDARQTAEEISRTSGPNEPPSYALALIYTALADKSTAIEWLERAYGAHDADICYLEVDPSLDPLRDDPRFAALVHRVGLP